MENQERRGRGEETKRRTCGDLHTAPPRRHSPGPTTEDATIEQGGTDRNEAERCGAEQQPAGLPGCSCLSGAHQPGPR